MHYVCHEINHFLNIFLNNITGHLIHTSELIISTHRLIIPMLSLIFTQCYIALPV